MRILPFAIAFVIPLAPLAAQDRASRETVSVPAAIVADEIPAIPMELAQRVKPYIESRSAAFRGWDAKDRSMIVSTRFGETNQLHRVAIPGGARTQITFADEPITTAVFTENGGDVLLTLKDTGGDEFHQIYRVENGRLILLTDGASRNTSLSTSPDGTIVAYSSTLRTGRDTDLWVMNPRNPDNARLVAEREGGGWSISDIAPDGRTAIVREYIRRTDIRLHLLDLETGSIEPLTSADTTAAYSGAKFDPQGRIWATTNLDNDFERLGTIDPDTGNFTPLIEEDWDIDSFAIAHDGSFLVYETNVAGSSQLKLYDLQTGAIRDVDLPPGVVSGLEVAPWNTIGFTLSSNTSPADAYSLDPETLAITQWTFSETGGIDPQDNATPELVEIESFDGEAMSGFLYRPDPTEFPGPRPLLVSIHGGPEGQTTANFKGSYNYLVNELGTAVFFPNVRGSSGYGKRFISLDDGPFLREDSVKDIGAFLDALEADPLIDAEHMAVRGGSYGGYMCYASAIRYGDRFDAASCVVAISDFVTFLENTQDYRRDLRRVEYGDERDPVQRAMLKEISPLTRADEIRIPLMVSTGANDPRVPASEAGQIIEAVRDGGVEAWHLLALNEGHGFAKKENSDYYTMAQILFLERHLLGESD